MKKNIRALGIDDSYFTPHVPGDVELVGVVMRAPNYIEGIIKRRIKVDGLDSTEKIIDMLRTRFGRQIKVIFTQGMTFGGFNIVDIERIYRETSIPVIAVSRKMPDMERISQALKKHFEDWKLRIELLSRHNIERIKNGRFTICVQYVGLDREEVGEILKLFTVRGAIPEPLRVAHLIASALYFQESRGKP